MAAPTTRLEARRFNSVLLPVPIVSLIAFSQGATTDELREIEGSCASVTFDEGKEIIGLGDQLGLVSTSSIFAVHRRVSHRAAAKSHVSPVGRYTLSAEARSQSCGLVTSRWRERVWARVMTQRLVGGAKLQ